MNLQISQESTKCYGDSLSLSEKSCLIAKDEDTIKEQRKQTATTNTGKWTVRKVIILSLLAFVYFLTWCCVSLWASFFPVEAEKRGVSSTEVGLIYGTYSLVAFVASFLYGPFIVPRIGPYFVLFAGLFVNGGTNIICGFINAITEHRLFSIYCLIVRSVGALGGAACETAIVVIVADEFRENIAIAIGLLRVFTGLGFIIGPVLGGGLYSLGGFGLPLFVTGGSLLAALPFVWFFLPRKESHHVEMSSGRKPSLKRAMLIPGVIVTSFSYLMGVIAISFIEPVLQPFAEEFGINTTEVGLLFLSISGTYVLSAPIIGHVLDRKPLRRTFIIIGGFAIFICSLLYGPAPFLSSFIPRRVWLLVVSLGLGGIAFAFALVPTLPELLHCCYERGFPKDMSTDALVSGIYTGFANLGAFIGPAIGGILTDSVGFPWTSAIIGFAVAFTAVLLMIFFFFNRHQKINEFDRPGNARLTDTLNVYYRRSMSLSIEA